MKTDDALKRLTEELVSDLSSPEPRDCILATLGISQKSGAVHLTSWPERAYAHI